MAVYKVRPGPRGRKIYFQDNKMISIKVIPEEVLQELESATEVDDRFIERPQPAKQCLFCGAFAKNERLVNLRLVMLCDEHYFGKTVGQVAQQLNAIA